MKFVHGNNPASFVFGLSGRAIVLAGVAPTEVEGFETVAGFTPIARWDTVIGESVVDGATYRPGIVAYSPNGIEKVVFTCNGTEYTVTEMATNPDTGEEEYYPEIDTTGLSSESQPIQVTAVIYDNNGEQIQFDQLPDPYGSINAFSATIDRPGEVAHCFCCLTSSPDVYYIAPFGHIPANENAEIGTADNPYKAEDGDNSYNDTAVEQILLDLIGNVLLTSVNTAIEVRMLPGTYTGADLSIQSYPLRGNPILRRWKFVNTGDQSDVIINRQITASYARVLYEFHNITFDLSNALGDETEGVGANVMFSGAPKSQILFKDCKFTSFKPRTVQITNELDESTSVDNWPVPVYSKTADDNFAVQYIGCLVQNSMKPDLPWSRQCRIERAAEDLTGGVLHLSLTAVDCSKINYPRAYADDIHQDVWQGFKAGGTFSNVILRNYNLIRFVGEGPFFSGNTVLFSRVAMIDCDFGLTNREPGTGETGLEDNVPFTPDPARTNVNNPGLNGTGFAVDQLNALDEYDNSQIKDDEQRFFLAPGSFGDGPVIVLQGGASDWYVKNCTIFSRSLMKHRGFDEPDKPVAFAGERIVFEDCFNEEIADAETGARVLFVPGSTTPNGYDDLQSFIALVNGSAASGLSDVVFVPDLTADYSEWHAKKTPGDLGGNAYQSIWTSGARYRVTTGLDPNTQYPT